MLRKQGIRFWDERTFWHEIIYKSLIPILLANREPKVGTKLFINYLIPECSLVPKSYSLFPYFLYTIEFNPYSPFEFLIFYHSSYTYIDYRFLKK